MGPAGLLSKRVSSTTPVELQHIGVVTWCKSHHAQGEHSPVRDWSLQGDLVHAEEEAPTPTPRHDPTCDGWY